MGYNVKTIEKKDYQGKPFLNVGLADGSGNITQASIWKVQKDGSEFPGFDSIGIGSVLEGNLYNKPGTQFYTLYPIKPKTGGHGMGGGMGKALMEEKQNGIKQSMERKEEGIKVSATFREAIAITLSQLNGKNFSDDEFRQMAVNWRRWLNKFYDDKLTSAGTEVPFEDDGLDQITVEDVAF